MYSRSFTEAEEPPVATFRLMIAHIILIVSISLTHFQKIRNQKCCSALLYGSDITVFIDRARAREIGPAEKKVEIFWWFFAH
jgi:hypothetical protein